MGRGVNLKTPILPKLFTENEGNQITNMFYYYIASIYMIKYEVFSKNNIILMEMWGGGNFAIFRTYSLKSII